MPRAGIFMMLLLGSALVATSYLVPDATPEEEVFDASGQLDRVFSANDLAAVRMPLRLAGALTILGGLAGFALAPRDPDEEEGAGTPQSGATPPDLPLPDFPDTPDTITPSSDPLLLAAARQAAAGGLVGLTPLRPSALAEVDDDPGPAQVARMAAQATAQGPLPPSAVRVDEKLDPSVDPFDPMTWSSAAGLFFEFSVRPDRFVEVAMAAHDQCPRVLVGLLDDLEQRGSRLVAVLGTPEAVRDYGAVLARQLASADVEPPEQRWRWDAEGADFALRLGELRRGRYVARDVRSPG